MLPMSEDIQTKLSQIEQTIASLKNLLSGQALEDALKPLLAEQVTLRAQLTGQGVITQASELTAGDRGVTGSSAGRDIITGDGNSVTTIINQYLAHSDRPPDEATLRRQMASYLNWMVDRYRTIELRGIKREGQQVVQLNLETVYVPLAARAYRGTEPKEISLVQVLQQGQRVVITGGPGSGKTTVLLHLAYTLSYAIGTNNPALAKDKLGLTVPAPPPPSGFTTWKNYFARQTPEQQARFLAEQGDCQSWEDYFLQFVSLPLPILIPLSSYALYLRQLPAGAKSDEKTLAAFISHYLIQTQTSFELPTDFFKQLLRSGQNIILLLDGLDEVPTEPERAEVRQAIEHLLTGREQMRVVVTCRTAAYKGRTALGKGFRPVQVLPLDEEHVAHLVRQAYADIYSYDPQTAQRKGDELLQAIADLERQRRQRFGRETEPLITSPLLVRMLLVVHYSERRLPEQRAELYMKATDAMLLPEYAPDEAVANRLGRLVGQSQSVHRELVQHLAFEMHQRGETQGREIEEDDLRRVLQNHPSYAHLTEDFIGLTRQRGTLLEERLGQYRFLHLAFQEYLTARYLAETVRSESGLTGIVEFLESGPLLDSWWREPALLVAGYLSTGSPSMAQKFLRCLAGLAKEQGSRPSKALPAEVQLAATELAGAAALEWPTGPANLKTELAARLAHFYQNPALLADTAPVWRATAGNTLARLGDPRSGLTTLEAMEFCYVPAGPFIMGEGDNTHQNDCLNYGYWLARYPVTVAQFRAFVEASGYQPYDADSLGGLPNHPVIWITWHDALAFCRWLTETWHGQALLPVGWSVTLPSEAEWEKAARGGLEKPDQPFIEPVHQIAGWEPTVSLEFNPFSQRRYPWGDEADPNRANYDESGIGSTSAVGCFPGGTSPYGCEEMSGNAWEWTRSLWGQEAKPTFNYPYDPQDGREDLEAPNEFRRVLRGGSVDDNGRSVRCAVRGRFNPGSGNWFSGFRVVLSPLTSGL